MEPPVLGPSQPENTGPLSPTNRPDDRQYTNSLSRRANNASRASFENNEQPIDQPKLESGKFSKVISKVANKIKEKINSIEFFKKIDQRLHPERYLQQKQPDPEQGASTRPINHPEEVLRDNSAATLAARNIKRIEQEIGRLELEYPKLLLPKDWDDPNIKGLRLTYEKLHEEVGKLHDPNSIGSALAFYKENFGGDKLSEFTNADELRQKLAEFKSEHPIVRQLERKVKSAASHPGLAYNLKSGIGSLTGPENFIYRGYLDIQKRLKFLESPTLQRGPPLTLQSGPPLTDSILDLFDDPIQSPITTTPSLESLTESTLDQFDNLTTSQFSEALANQRPIEKETHEYRSQFADRNGGVVLKYDPTDDTQSKVTIRFENGKEVTGGLRGVINALIDRIGPEKSQEMREGALKVLRSLLEALSQAKETQEANGVQDDNLNGHFDYVYLAIFSVEESL